MYDSDDVTIDPIACKLAIYQGTEYQGILCPDLVHTTSETFGTLKKERNKQRFESEEYKLIQEEIAKEMDQEKSRQMDQSDEDAIDLAKKMNEEKLFKKSVYKN